MRYASYTDRRKMAQALRPIYTAATEEAAKLALEEFRAQWKNKSPGAVAVWDRAWAEFVPFLAFPVEIRKIIYTTNAIVICSAAVSVFHVDHEVSKWSVLRSGCGYLQPSMKQSLEDRCACCEGGFTALVA